MRFASIVAGMMAAFGVGAAQASEAVAGKPVPDGTGFQRPVTELAADLLWMDDFLLVVITIISVFVMGLLAYVIVRFNKKNNPTPAKFTHHALLEVVWTAVPVVILVAIAIPSVRLLDKQLTVPEADMVVKATGNQWFWDYEYPEEEISFSAFMLAKDELEEHGYLPDEHLLATDERMVIPVGKVVHMLITAADVIHAWTIPSFGVKIDAVPGRINELWFKAEETGTYFGQCSELCGKDHSYMPIVVEVVSEEDYAAWVAEQTAKATGTSEFAKAAGKISAE